MKKKILGLVIGGLVLCIFVAIIAYAQRYRVGRVAGGQAGEQRMGEQRMGEQRMGEQQEEIMEELCLTPEQKKKMGASGESQRQAMQKLFTALDENQTQLQEAFNYPSVTREALEPIAKEIKSLQGQLVDQRISGILAIKEILTPEQFVDFQKITEERRRQMRERIPDLRQKEE